MSKTQLAAHYAREQWQDPDIDPIVWVPAGSTASIIDTYA
jgi:hypothetical protein